MTLVGKSMGDIRAYYRLIANYAHNRELSHHRVV